MKQHTFSSFSRGTYITLFLVVLAWVLSLAVLPWAPASVPTHWGLNNQPDRYSSAFPGLFIMPFTMTLMVVLFNVLPYIDPRRQNYPAFAKAYTFIQVLVLLFLSVMHVVTLLAAFGNQIPMNLVVMPLLGMLLIGLGNVMGKIRPNWFVGIRTPWTLSSPDVWTRTHRFGGMVMVIVGIVTIIGWVLLPPTVSMMLGIGGCLVMAASTLGYSYLVWRELNGAHE